MPCATPKQPLAGYPQGPTLWRSRTTEELFSRLDGFPDVADVDEVDDCSGASETFGLNSKHEVREFSRPSSVSRLFGGFIAQQLSSSQSAVAPGRRSSRLP